MQRYIDGIIINLISPEIKKIISDNSSLLLLAVVITSSLIYIILKRKFRKILEYEYEKVIQILDYLDNTGEKVKYFREGQAKCLNGFFESIRDGFRVDGDIQENSFSITNASYTKENDFNYIKISPHESLRKNEKFVFQTRCIILNTFKASTEYWNIVPYYETKRFEFSIIYPKQFGKISVRTKKIHTDHTEDFIVPEIITLKENTDTFKTTISLNDLKVAYKEYTGLKPLIRYQIEWSFSHK